MSMCIPLLCPVWPTNQGLTGTSSHRHRATHSKRMWTRLLQTSRSGDRPITICMESIDTLPYPIRVDDVLVYLFFFLSLKCQTMEGSRASGVIDSQSCERVAVRGRASPALCICVNKHAHCQKPVSVIMTMKTYCYLPFPLLHKFIWCD